MYDISIIYKLQEMTFTQGCSGIEDFPVHLHQLISNFTIFLIFKNILIYTAPSDWRYIPCFIFPPFASVSPPYRAKDALASLRCVYFSIGTFLDPRSQNVFQAVESEELIEAIVGMHLSQCTWLTSRKNENVMKNGFKTIGDGKLPVIVLFC